MKRKRGLDLYCGQGGCSRGYTDSGFDMTGVDISPQPRYPYRFIQADALEYLAEHYQEYDFVHASPPCQGYSVTRNLKMARGYHPMMIEAVREMLQATGKPYVIENVPGAPLINPLMLCGTMFGLGVIRHRLFECNPPIWFPPASCNHDGKTVPMWWSDRRRALKAGESFRYVTVAGRSFLMPEARQAMGIDWMNQDGLRQAIPPVYTEYVGRILMAACARRHPRV